MNKFLLHAFIIFSIFTVACGVSEITAAKTENPNNVSGAIENEPAETATNDKLLLEGEFRNADKTGSGTASVYQTENGKRILRLTNFKTASGPDLFVYIYEKADAKNSKELKNVKYVSLGRLKSQNGNQEYEIPADVDLENSVRFRFGAKSSA
ncbi:MAG: DM13 domain-containing protein [Blastocatellia bacterium]|nr:DM13 domain-containing protein [Blastocatellia bacterium]